MKLPLVAALMVGIILASCTSEQAVTVDTLLDTHQMRMETMLEANNELQLELQRAGIAADNELQLELQRAGIAWDIVLAQGRTIDWSTEELIEEFDRAYLALGRVGPWTNSDE